MRKMAISAPIMAQRTEPNPDIPCSCSDTSDTFWEKCGFSTRAIHASQDPVKCELNAIVPPIFSSTNFKWKSPHNQGKYSYGRNSNPTRDMLESCLASLEGAKYALTFASGVSAESAILSMLSSNDHVIASMDLYGGTRRLLENYISRNAFEVTFVDLILSDNLNRAIRHNTKIVWFESPTTTLMKVFDINKIARVSHERGTIIVVHDNTYLTPYFQRPLDHGVDISLCSLSKYMNGHSDVIMGSAALNSSDLEKKLRHTRNCTGVIPSSFDCYLVNRSLKTLAIRMERHQRNSLEVAMYLERHPRITRVLHPDLKSHPSYDLFHHQARGHSGVFSFRHLGGRHETDVILSTVKIFTMAESLGGYESLIGFPYIMSHGYLPLEEKESMGISENLIILSVGLEEAQDLIADLECALKKAFPG